MARRKLPNGYGSITKLSGKRSKPYWARLSLFIDLDGNTDRPTLGFFATYDEAYDSLVKYHFNPYKKI